MTGPAVAQTERRDLEDVSAGDQRITDWAAEEAEEPANARVLDPIGKALGKPGYLSNWRPPWGGGRDFSRYYFRAGLVVDLLNEPRHTRKEVLALRSTLCEEHGLKYLAVCAGEELKVGQLNAVMEGQHGA